MAEVRYRLALDSAEFSRGVAKAQADFTGFSGRMKSGANDAADSAARLSSAIAKVGHYTAGLLAFGGLQQAARGVAQLADEYATLQGRLRTVTDTQTEFAQAQADVAGIADRQRKGLSEIAELYASASAAALDLGASQAQIARFTEGVAASLTAGGTSAQAAAGALTQLSQAIGGSVVRAQEFNSLLNGARPLLQAVADNVAVAGGSIARLRELVNDGKISSRQFFEAAVAGSDALKASAAQMPTTIGQALTVARNEWMLYVAAMDQTSGASQAVGATIETLARNIDTLVTVGAAAASVAFGRMAAAMAQSAGAALAERAARVAGLADQVRHTQAVALHTSFVLADTRATLAQAAGFGASLRAQNAVIAATQRHTAALAAQAAAQTALNNATSVGVGALRLLGGPLGAAITALSVGATLWATWGTSAAAANERAATSTRRSTAEIVSDLDRQAEKLEQMNRLRAGASREVATVGGPGAEDLATLGDRITELMNRTGEAAKLNETARQEILRVTLMQYAELESSIKRVARAQQEASSLTSAEALQKFMQTYATAGERFEAELKKQKAALGDLFTPALEKRLRDHFVKPAREGQSAYAQLSTEIGRTLAGLQARAAAGGELTQAQQLEISLTNKLSDAVAKLSPVQQQRVKDLIDQTVAQQRANDAEEERLRILARQGKAVLQMEEERSQHEVEKIAWEKARREAFEAQTQSVADRLIALQSEERALADSIGLNISLAEAIERVTLRRLEDRRATLVNDAQGLAELEKQIALQEQIVRATAGREGREAAARAAQDSARAWQSAADDISSSLTDAFRRSFEQGGSFAKSLGQVIERELKARIAAGLAGFFAESALRLVLGQPAGSSSGGGTNWMQGASTASNLYNAYNSGGLYGAAQSAMVNTAWGSAFWYGSGSGLAAGGGAAANIGGTSAGAILGDGSAYSVANAAGGGGTGAASTVTTAAQVAAGVAAGIYGGRAVSGGYAAAGSDSGNSYVNAGTAVGAAIGAYFGMPGVGAAVGGWAGGLVNRAIGYRPEQLDSRGVAGALGPGGFVGEAFATYRQEGGWFRSDKVRSEYGAVADALSNALSDGARQVYESALKYGSVLGLPAESLAGISTDIKLLLGEDIDANRREIEAALSLYGDNLGAAWQQAVSPVAQYGETVAQTIRRVGGALLSVNDVLQALGLTALETSVDGGQAALALQNLFGDIGTLQGAAGNFLRNYYSEAERTTLATDGIARALAQVSLEMPSTRDAFRDLVQAQDLATASGREAFAVLMGVSDAFAQIVPAARDAQDILRERLGLERELMQLQGDTASLRGLERAAIHESNLALYDNIRALEDQAAAAQRAAELTRGLQSAVDTNIGRFLSPEQRIDYDRQRVADALTAAGIEVSGRELAALSMQQVFDLAEAIVGMSSVSTEAKIAVVDAAGALYDLAAAAADLQRTGIESQLAAIFDEFGDVEGALAPATERLAEAFGRTASEVGSLEASLAQMLGTAGRSVQEALSDMLSGQQQLQAYRSGALADAIESARMSTLTPEGRISSLRAREAILSAQIGSAADPVAVAQQLQRVALDRIREEASLQGKAYADQITALERLRGLSAEIAQFTSSLRFSDLSPLSYADQRYEAESLFERTLALAREGDENAQRNLLQNARAYLEEERAYSASSQAFAAVFARVTGALDEFGAQGLDVDPQIAALEELRLATESTGAQTYGALLSIDAALALREDVNATRIARQIELAQEQIAQARQTNEELRAQVVQQAEGVRQLRAQLEAVNAKLDVIVREETLAAGRP